MTNDQLVLICGPSAAGKSASLRNLENQEGVMYLNCESGKKLPFKHDFAEFKITDPWQVHQAFDAVAAGEVKHPKTGEKVKIHTIIIDSLTFLLDMFESVYIINADDGRSAWQEFQQYFKNLMQQHVTKSPASVIFTAHTLTTYNEKEMVMETKIPVKGALKNNGIESYFSTVVAAKKVSLSTLEGYESDLLEITPEEEALGFKYVFQTKLTKDTVNERIRSPMALFSTQETFMDNDCQKLLDHLKKYYS